MKICLISTEGLPTPPIGYWGGIESTVYDLSCALTDLGHEVTLVGRPGSKSPGKLIETFPDVPDELGSEERHFNAYKSYVENFDGVVHDHTNGKKAHTIHWDVLNTMHWCQDPLAVQYKNISTQSHAHARWTEQFMPAGHDIEVVPTGTNAERFIYREEKEDYYLFFSVLARYKGAFDALKLAEDTGKKFVFAGRDGDACGTLESSSLPNVKYLGTISNPERAELMSRAKALVFPTGCFGKVHWLEVFGLVQLEALASGTPVIASNNGACPEVVEHGRTGFICKTYEDMKRVIEENLVEDINPKTCRQMTEGKFSAKAMAEGYVKLYEKLLSGETW